MIRCRNKVSDPSQAMVRWHHLKSDFRSFGLTVLVTYVLCFCTFDASAENTTYYVTTGSSGNNSNDGLSADTPWETMMKLETMTFGPGDQILFRKGKVFSGSFELNGNGAEGNPIVIGSYGEGDDKPSLQARDSDDEVIRLKKNQHVAIKDLEIMNDNNGNDVNYGIRVQHSADSGSFSGLEFSNLDFKKIRGLTEECFGIYAESETDNNGTSHWDGVLIENCTFDTINGAGCKWKDKSGVNADQDRAHWYPTLNFVFRNNYGTNLQKYLVSWSGCEGALVEHNLGDEVGTTHGNGM